MNFTIIFYISLALLGAILILNTKRRPSEEGPFFDRIVSKEIQGFLALFIIFHQTVVTLIHFEVLDTEMKVITPMGANLQICAKYAQKCSLTPNGGTLRK